MNQIPESDLAGEKLDYYTWVLIAQCRQAADDLRKKELKKYRITPKQSAVLMSINAIGEEATPTEISRWIGRKPHTISGILIRMEKQGLLTSTTALSTKNQL